jgi:DNA-binding MarR family transcriptional regulator
MAGRETVSSHATILEELPERAETGEPQLPLVWHMMGEEGLMQRLLVLAKMIDRVTSRQLQSEFGLSVAQWRVLAFVCISGPATAAFIGEAAEVDQAEISRAVKALGEQAIISRDFEPGSRKTMVIAPTARGREVFEQVRTRRRAYFVRITGGLDAAERAELNRMLEVLARSVVAERAEPAQG